MNTDNRMPTEKTTKKPEPPDGFQILDHGTIHREDLFFYDGEWSKACVVGSIIGEEIAVHYLTIARKLP